MKQLKFNEESYFAEKIVKTDNSITGYVNNDRVFEFRGISDFSQFSLEDGEEWDIPKDEIEQVRLEMARSNTELFETMLLLMGGA